MISKREWLPGFQYFIEKTIEDIAMWGSEWKEPNKKTYTIFFDYKININGEVTWKKWIKMKYRFRKWNRSPFVVLQRNIKDEKWKFKKQQKEIKITKLMEEKFQEYIKGYSKMRSSHEKYIIIPQDWDWENMSLKNLEYVPKKEYNLNWTKKQLLSNLTPIIKDKSDTQIAEMLDISRSWVNKTKNDMKKNWNLWHSKLNDLTISNKNYPIYLALLKCKWLSSNLEIAKNLWPNEDFLNLENKKKLTNKVVRVRKILFNKWLIEKYNTYQKTVNIESIRAKLKKTLITNKNLSKEKRKTHQQIAEIFWLDKQQVDNFSRKLK